MITRVRGNVATGLFVRGHVCHQWRVDGTDITTNPELDSENTIISEVTCHENRNDFGSHQRSVSR